MIHLYDIYLPRDTTPSKRYEMYHDRYDMYHDRYDMYHDLITNDTILTNI